MKPEMTPVQDSSDRRGPDRRRGDRRSEPRRDTEADAMLREGDGRTVPRDPGHPSDVADAARREPSEGPRAIAEGVLGDRALSGEGEANSGFQESALARIFRTYIAARAATGVALLAVQIFIHLVGGKPTAPVVLICAAYVLQAAGLWLMPRHAEQSWPLGQAMRRRRQWVLTIGVDLTAFSLLHGIASSASLNFGALLVLPVLMAGVLTSRRVALATASGVALFLLAMSWVGPWAAADGAAGLAQSGLAGLGLLVVTVLAGEIAGRLLRQELAAQGSLEIARQQAQLNRLVIEEMADGLLVVDGRLRVRAANPAARTLLTSQGQTPPAPFQLQARAVWAPLSAAVERALIERSWPDAGRDVRLQFSEGLSRTLRVRVRFTRPGAQTPPGASSPVPAEEFCVLLLEDVRTAAARLRKEKLAAMGRVSAGIAHEIRNPLAAISQANALMLEDELSEPQRRLARMLADNVRRLQRIVDDVLEAAPGVGAEPRPLEARAEVESSALEWARTAQIAPGPGSRLRLDLPSTPVSVVFDPEHLRRVLVNLLDNAVRHGTPGPDAVVLRLSVRDEATAVLSVSNDGPPIAPDVEPHLFEPFFSTRSRGSGLGLYICRELCERYGASIEYRPRPATERHRNGFVVVMLRPPPSPAVPAEPT